MLNALSILTGLLSLLIVIPSQIPFLGWGNWVALPVLVVGIVLGALSRSMTGWLSDRYQRRKPFVILGSLIMGCAMVAPLVAPTMQGMWVYAAIIGVGYGMFMSIDMALMTQVLPKSALGDEGKDLGILTTAVNIPQIISPVMAAILLSAFGNDYRTIFWAAVVFVFGSALCVFPIKSVR